MLKARARSKGYLWIEGDSYMAATEGDDLGTRFQRGWHNTAVSGSTLQQISDRIAANTALQGRPLVVWDGICNGYGTLAEDMAKYAAIAAAVDRVIFLPPVRVRAGVAGENAAAIDIRTALAAAYPGTYIDAVQILADAGDPVADATDIADGYVPASLLFGDNIHINATAYGAVNVETVALLSQLGW